MESVDDQTTVSNRNNGKNNDSKESTASKCDEERAKMKEDKTSQASDLLKEEDFKGQEEWEKPAAVELYYTVVQRKRKSGKKLAKIKK